MVEVSSSSPAQTPGGGGASHKPGPRLDVPSPTPPTCGASLCVARVQASFRVLMGKEGMVTIVTGLRTVWPTSCG